VGESKLTKWQVTQSELVLDNRWARVRRDTCTLPDGSHIDDYFYWEGNDFAQVFALTSDERVVLVRQYKHGVKDIVLELPAGMVSENDVDPAATARRELAEETGFDAPTWRQLGILYPSSAKSATRCFAYLALQARLVHSTHPDATEIIEVEKYSVPDLLQLIATGEIRDSNSIAICLLALTALNRI